MDEEEACTTNQASTGPRRGSRWSPARRSPSSTPTRAGCLGRWLGAAPWAERAATELRATGQTVPRRDAPAIRLTPQETQVVRLVAEGGSNQEVAAQLLLSPRTVAYHLYKAFPKLGVTSRAELARLDLDALATG
jgi:DNA-binding CsgD family transcriptional regulator